MMMLIMMMTLLTVGQFSGRLKTEMFLRSYRPTLQRSRQS